MASHVIVRRQGPQQSGERRMATHRASVTREAVRRHSLGASDYKLTGMLSLDRMVDWEDVRQAQRNILNLASSRLWSCFAFGYSICWRRCLPPDIGQDCHTADPGMSWAFNILEFTTTAIPWTGFKEIINAESLPTWMLSRMQHLVWQPYRSPARAYEAAL